MGRPQKVSDEAVLTAAARVIGQHGPGFTLSQVAAIAGVAVGTVATRFGSKHGLLLALLDMSTAQVRERMLAIAGEHADPIAAIRAALLVPAEELADPRTTANHLAQLGTDLGDPGLRARLAHQRDATREVLTELLTEAELPAAPPADRAAYLLAALVHGVQLDWALQPRGALREQLTEHIDAVLAGWQGAAAPWHTAGRGES